MITKKKKKYPPYLVSQAENLYKGGISPQVYPALILLLLSYYSY